MSKQEEIVGKGISDAIGGEMAKEKEAPKKLSRKDFVKGAAVVAGAGALASCAPAATPAPADTPAPCPTCPPAEECPPCPTPAAAGEAGPVTLELYDPSGAYEVTVLHAARLDSLEGKTICEVTDGSWEDQRTFAVIRELLQEMYPTAKFVTYDNFPTITNVLTVADMAGIATEMKEMGCDAVISGNAG